MRKAVLCVHDEELARCLKKRLCEGAVAEIIECSSARESADTALETVSALVVLEAPSPGEAISAAAARIRERSAMPVIVIAESCSREEMSRAAQSGVSAILTKPVKEADLCAALELALAAAAQVDKLQVEVSQLREQIESRKVVEKAKGKLMEREKLTEAEAFRRMQRLAMDRRISMRQLAEAILLTDRIAH